MRITIAAIGRLRAGPELTLLQSYLARIRKWPIDVKEIELRNPAKDIARRRRDEADALRKALPAGATIVALDETGKQLGSEGLAKRLQGWHDTAVGDLGLVIGGPDGHEAGLIGDANLVVSLGSYTWPHLLVRVMLAEQIYRAQQIIDGHPYHRA